MASSIKDNVIKAPRPKPKLRRREPHAPAKIVPFAPLRLGGAPPTTRGQRLGVRNSGVVAPGFSPAPVAAICDRRIVEHSSTLQGGATTSQSLIPALRLLPFQRRWVEDDSQFKIVVKARQVGYSFAATLRAVLKCLERKTTWIFLSKGERQSRLLMEKVQEHIRSCGIVARAHESTFFEGSLIKQLETRFPNGSVIYGLPANPDTARGYTGNVTLDEFAFHQDAAKVYSALYPTITRGFSIEVISTPNGQQGKFFELAKNAGLIDSTTPQSPPYQGGDSNSPPSLGGGQGVVGHSRWSAHKVDIYQAVRQGLRVDVDLLRAGCDDEETWLQEYCCAFLSDAANYIPMELIVGCQSESATTDWPDCHPERSEGSLHLNAGILRSAQNDMRGDLYLGVDIGRKRDLTVAWLFEKLGDVLWSRALLVLKGQTFEIQERAICDLVEGNYECGMMNDVTTPDSPPKLGGERPDSSGRGGHSARVRRCCVDQSGLGMMLAERLQKKFPGIVEPVQITAQVKERLAPMVKQAFEERRVRIPDNREIRADINAVKRFVTPAGNVRFDAEHTDKGHADRFWALALALSAAAQPTYHLAGVGALVGKPVAAGMRERVL